MWLYYSKMKIEIMKKSTPKNRWEENFIRKIKARSLFIFVWAIGFRKISILYRTKKKVISSFSFIYIIYSSISRINIQICILEINIYHIHCNCLRACEFLASYMFFLSQGSIKKWSLCEKVRFMYTSLFVDSTYEIGLW